ncbi:MAG TPA: TlpA disulfide reductase family protein [Caulobacteraceae bacterium]|nr:TlpA disulfide reductase family protein [Caulobacteraceae bacterium]
MGEGPKERSKGAGRLGLVALGAAVVLGLGGGALYLSNRDVLKAPVAAARPDVLARYAKGSLARLESPATPTRLGELAFNDAAGRPQDMAAFRGRVVVLNLWATWCAPCVVEMPTLASLQKAYPTDKVMVVPVSMDPDRMLENARNFIDVNDPLPLFHDPKFVLPTTLGVKGMPATVVYDRRGREVGRVMGEANWDSPEARALIDYALTL